ncbi:hypothetical protein PG291_06425 [Riemerella anatipestifer]|nr:hypothetical protein [Riemerella anatipestifer]
MARLSCWRASAKKERLPEDRPISLGNSLGLGHAQIFIKLIRLML